MKLIFRKIFRDIPSSVLLMIGFGLTIFITMLGCDFINNIMSSKEKNNDKVNYYYLGVSHTERKVEVYGDGQVTYLEEGTEGVKYESIYYIMKDNNVNYYNEAIVSIGEGQEQQFFATSIKSFDRTESFKLQSGYVDWSDKKTVIIGETIKSYIEKKRNKDYLLVDGEYYEVTGILENSSSGGYDSSIYFVNDNIYENVPENIDYEFESDIAFGLIPEIVVFMKDEKDVEKLNAAQRELEQQLPLNVSISSEPSKDVNDDDIINSVYEKLNKIFLPVLLIFSIGSCCSISSLWIKVRKTDIAIKLTYGFSRYKIFSWILKELSVLLGISLLSLLTIRVTYLAIYSDISLNRVNIIYDALIILGAMLITLFITSFGAYRYSKLIVPATVLKEL